MLHVDYLADNSHFASSHFLIFKWDQRLMTKKKTSPVLLCHLVTAHSSKLQKSSELLEIFNLLPTPKMAASWEKIRFSEQRKLYIFPAIHFIHLWVKYINSFVLQEGRWGLVMLSVCDCVYMCAHVHKPLLMWRKGGHPVKWRRLINQAPPSPQHQGLLK